jgi:hypothetical protein
MTRLAKLINQLDNAAMLLTLQVQMEQARQTELYYLHLLKSYQRVSLAEKQFQVKNRCSPISSENR